MFDTLIYSASEQRLPAALRRRLARMADEQRAARRAAGGRRALSQLPRHLLRDIGIEPGRLSEVHLL